MRKVILALGVAMVMAACAGTRPGDSEAGVLDASWTEPTTNVDGTALIDLASYKVYFMASPGTPCPGGGFITVQAVNPAPAANSRLSQHLTGLQVGKNYTIMVTAVNVDGKESACSAAASANARPSTPGAPAGIGAN